MSRKTVAAVAWCSAMALSLAAQARPAERSGPDVIVGDVIDASSFGAGTGLAASRYAYSLGTSSCNAGTVNVLWQSTVALHPVIGQNVYRLRNGRMEQIGMSWLKHGFTALTENICGFGCSQVGGTVLGVGCSDPYTSSLNGTQTRLGPRFEVNPSTGMYVYPQTQYPAVVVTSGPGATDETTINRRLQIMGADIDFTAGVQYFGECQYVTLDDAMVGNGWNNVSYRTMAFSNNANKTAAMTGSTVREKPVIQAWRDNGLGAGVADPDVTVFPVDVPGDGRFWIGCKVTDLGGGMWHYEYAIENLTSNRAAGMFSVPLPMGAAVSGAESHNAFHHSGEPYDNRPFLAATDGAAVTFLPQDLSTLGSGPGSGELPWSTTGSAPTVKNAVRWGTLYNFRFDCNVAPAAGSAKLGLDLPGQGAFATLSDVNVAIKTPGGAAVLPTLAFNNDCTAAASLHEGTNGWSTLGATGVGPDACNAGGSAAIDSDVWFTYSYTTFGQTCLTSTLTFTTCGSTFPAKIAVYGACPGTTDSPLACAAGNLTSCAGAIAQSTVTLTPTANTTYLIRVGSVTGATGNVMVNVTVPVCTPPNVACCLASGVCSTMAAASCTAQSGTPRTGSTTCPPTPACAQPNMVCCAPAGTCTVLPLGSTTCVGTIQAGGSCPPTPACPLPPPPANDACANAIWLADGVLVTGSTAQATFSSSDAGAPGCNSSTAKDVWYKYKPLASNATPPGSTANVNVNSCGSSYDTVITLHTGTCGAATLTQVWCNDDYGSGTGTAAGNGACTGSASSTPSGLTYPMTVGTTYLIRMAGYNANSGAYNLVAIGGGGAIPPANDSCAARTTVSDGATAFSTAGATTDGAVPACAGIASGNIDNDVWFKYTATLTGTLTAGTCGSSFNTRIAVYAGDGCASFDTRLAACSDDFASCSGGTGTQSLVTLPITQGSVYVIRVGGTAGASGAGTLTLSSAATQGACCAGTSCSISTAAACAAGFQGVGSVCGGVGNPTTCCKANFDGNNGIAIDDIFVFLNAWFQSLPGANVDGVNGVSIDDIFVFLNLWFAGC